MDKNKKVWLLGLLLVIVLAGVTTLVKSRTGMMRYLESDFGGVVSIGPNEMMLEEQRASKMGYAADTQMGMAIEPAMMPPDMLPRYYDPNLGLDEEVRLYNRSSDFSVIVDDVQLYLRSFREYLISVDGVVITDTFFQSEKWKAGTLYAKVPVEKFQEANDRAVETVEEIYGSSSNSEDVTGSHVSATERLADLQSLLAETQAALETAEAKLAAATSGSVEWRQYRTEVLQLENKVAAYEQQIKQYQENVENIEAQVEYASIYVTAADSKRYFDPQSELSLLEHVQQALESLGKSGYLLISFLIWVVVYSVLWVPLVLVYLWFKGKNLSKK